MTAMFDRMHALYWLHWPFRGRMSNAVNRHCFALSEHLNRHGE